MYGGYMKYTSYLYVILVFFSSLLFHPTEDYPKSFIYYDNFQYTDNVLFYGVDDLNVQYEGELSYLGDSYELSFDVVNSSNMDVGISDLVLQSHDPYLEYSLTYENGKKVLIGDTLKAGEKRRLKYHVLWKNPIDKDDYELDSSFYIDYL